jgi:hypothetical protein
MIKVDPVSMSGGTIDIVPALFPIHARADTKPLVVSLNQT